MTHKKVRSPNKLPTGSSGEVGLWKAVFSQAILDTGSRDQKARAKVDKREAISWLTNNGLDFKYVCDLIGYDPDFVSERMKIALATDRSWITDFGKENL